MTVDADAFKAFEVAGWEQQAPTYDDFFGQITQRFVDPLLDAAGVERGSRVLDVATGPGYAAGKAAARGASVVGVDAAPAMVRLARQRQPGIDFRRADIGRSAIRAAFDRRLLAYQRDGGGFALPVSAKLAVGRKGG